MVHILTKEDDSKGKKMWFRRISVAKLIFEILIELRTLYSYHMITILVFVVAGQVVASLMK